MAKEPLMISPEIELELYKKAIDISMAVVITNKKGLICYANENFFKITKYSEKEIIGKSFNLINSKHHTKEFFDGLWSTILSGKTWHGEIKNKKKDGYFFWADTTIVPLLNDKGQISQFMSVCIDITAVYEAAQIKNQFLANISHELRTPLHGIISTSDFLKETDLDRKQMKFTKLIKCSAETLLGMTNNIIELTSIESGNMAIEESDFDLHELVKSVADIFGIKAAEKNLELIVSVDNKIPHLLNGDVSKLKHIIFNLINNSVKFTIEGSINLSARLIGMKGDNYKIEIAVSDTGVGIPEDKKEMVFEKFSQLNNEPSREYGGLGLGLSIARELVELLNGKINLESYVDFGTKISFILDFSPGRNTVDKKGKVNKIKTDIKVLVVDDTQVNHFVAEKHLQKLGYKAQFSFDGFDAIEKIEKGDFDIVLMDIQMPVMDGCETIIKIRTELKEPKNKIPIIAVTANAIDSEIKRFKKIGANEYLAKPYNSSELNVLIERILSLENDDKVNDKKEVGFKDNIQDLIDLKWLNEMSGGDKSLIIEMIKLFIDIVPGTIADFNKYAKDSNWEGLRNVAHKYSTQVSYMGVNSIIDDVKNIEIYALKQQYIEVIRKLIIKINAVSIQAVEALSIVSDKLKKEL